MPAARRTRLLRWFWRAHRWIYRVSSGRIGSRAFGIRVLRLTTIGRVSGRPRSIMLYYFRFSQSYVVIALNAGDSRNPVWFDNLMANPRASVQIGPDYAEYQARTDRQIPIVILDPLPELEQVPGSPSMADGLE